MIRGLFLLCLSFCLSLVFSACTNSPTPLSDSLTMVKEPADASLQNLLDSALDDDYTYDKLGELCDTIGPRLTGSPNMKKAIAWSVRSMKEAGFDSVWTEPVTVPYWTRGREWARCTSPIEFDLILSGMGLSDGTGPDGIEAEILAVRNFDELEARADEAAGKIVLFNPPWEGYGKTVQYRVKGASAAARHGAVAVLIRSVTGVSLGAPHTGMMQYDDDAPRIPIAALTVEDSGRLYRMHQRGLKPVVKLYMEAANHDDVTSYNVVGDIRGRQHPEEIVLMGGHLDSWDVGTCAQDDGAGVALTLGAARMILQQDTRPAVLFGLCISPVRRWAAKAAESISKPTGSSWRIMCLLWRAMPVPTLPWVSLSRPTAWCVIISVNWLLPWPASPPENGASSKAAAVWTLGP